MPKIKILKLLDTVLQSTSFLNSVPVKFTNNGHAGMSRCKDVGGRVDSIPFKDQLVW